MTDPSPTKVSLEPQPKGVDGHSDSGGDGTSTYKNDMGDVVQVLEEERDRLVDLSTRESVFNWEDLPIEVKRRVCALKNNQLEITGVEAKFYEEMHDLECKYTNLMKEHFEKRRDIVNGFYEPSDEECNFTINLSEDEDEDSNALDSTKTKEQDERKKIQGVPEFWLNIFRNVDMLSLMTAEPDGPILKHLVDIEIEMMKDPMGFKLHFQFSPNKYFSNSVLTKTYGMRCEMNSEEPFSYEGTEIFKCSGCPIDWKDGENVTIKILNKKQKHKQTGTIRIVTKTIKARSFFNFFDPPKVPADSTDEMDEETQETLTTDFEVGQYIRERVIPRAVLYFTGEADDDDDYDTSEEEDDEDQEENEPEEEYLGLERTEIM